MQTTLTLRIQPKLRETFLEVCNSRGLSAEAVVSGLLEEFVKKALSVQMPIENWARELSRRFFGDISLSGDQEFADGLTIDEYFALSDEERAQLWRRWYSDAEEETKDIVAEDVSPDAIPA